MKSFFISGAGSGPVGSTVSSPIEIRIGEDIYPPNSSMESKEDPYIILSVEVVKHSLAQRLREFRAIPSKSKEPTTDIAINITRIS
jgi:hypothetical protein